MVRQVPAYTDIVPLQEDVKISWNENVDSVWVEDSDFNVGPLVGIGRGLPFHVAGDGRDNFYLLYEYDEDAHLVVFSEEDRCAGRIVDAVDKLLKKAADAGGMDC